jgi:MFS family permease
MTFTWGAVYSFGVFFKPMITELGWTRAATSGAYSLTFLVSGFLGILAGRLSDRLGPRLIITVCGMLIVTGYLLMSQVSLIWQIYLFYGVIIGVGLGGVYVPSVSTVARWFVKRRGLMTGIVIAGIGAGTMIVSPAASWLIANYGWRISYIIIGITVLVLMISAGQFLRRDPAMMGVKPYGGDVADQRDLNSETRGFSLRKALRSKQFWMLCLMFPTFEFCVNTIMVHIVPHATDLAISAANAANILAVIGMFSIAGRITMGITGDRIGNRQAFAICGVMMSVALIWLLFSQEPWMFYLFATIFGFAYGGYGPLISLVVADLFGLSSLGVILGVVTFSITIGAAVGPTLAGKIFDITGSYQTAFLVCIALSIIAITVALSLRSFTDKQSDNRGK